MSNLSTGYAEVSNTSVDGLDEIPDYLKDLELFLSGFLITAFACVGIVGNLISLTVLSKPSMRSSVNCVLQALAAFDCGVLAAAVLMLGLRHLGKSMSCFSYYSAHLYPFIVPVVYPLGLIFQTGSIWSTVAVTVERYVAVCHPLKARYLCTHRNAKFYNSLVVLFALVYNVPRFFEIHFDTYFDPDTNVTVIAVVPSDFRANQLYFEVYYIWCYLIFIYFVPFALLAVLNVLIWRSVRRANNDRRSLSSQQRRDMSMAVMLLSVVAVFLVCNLLGLVVNVLEYCKVVDPFHLAVMVHFSNFLVVVNSSINFVIYCYFGKRFKRMFLQVLFCRTCCGKGVVGKEVRLRRSSTQHYTKEVGDSNCEHEVNVAISSTQF